MLRTETNVGHEPQVRRTGIVASFLGLLKPGKPRSAEFNAASLTLRYRSKQAELVFADIEDVTLHKSWLWATLRFQTRSGAKTLFGLNKDEARAFFQSLDERRSTYWQNLVKEHKGLLHTVHAGVVALENPSRYVTVTLCSALEAGARQALLHLPPCWPERFANADEVRMLHDVKAFLGNSSEARAAANATFIERELVRSREFFDQIEARPLTEEQRRAVVIDEDRNLIVAAAGSGKTSVIVAKAGWLVRRSYKSPSEILLLAFAKDAQSEIQERIQNRLGEEIGSELTAKTFHGLGTTIIGEVETRRPSLANVAEDPAALFDLLKSTIRDLLSDQSFAKVMVKWFQSFFALYKSELEFKNLGEYWSYIRANGVRSLKGEQVKSFEECEIANYLYLNGINYIYEQAYEHDTATSARRQYKPDFYLPDAGIYIEHFALSASGNTPPFINQAEYLQSMEWKRQLHRQHGTVLIETFSHEKAAGKLTEALEAKLAVHGVLPSPIPASAVFSILEEQGRVDTFTRLAATFLQHFKGGQQTLAAVRQRAASTRDLQRALAFLEVFERIFERYEGWLRQRQEVDFHDMITRATEHVEAGRYSSPYRYILVDEFQDISQGRARLLKALLRQNPETQLFAVGDDWQAIFRFAGADIALMRNFGREFGNSELISMGTTFRCVDRIADVATKFILRNSAQIPKKVTSGKKAAEARVHLCFAENNGSDLVKVALERISLEVQQQQLANSVLILGRYNHLKPENLAALKRRFSNLDLEFKTIHRSKGLEADFVIVAGLTAGKYGFPSEISDDPLLDLVLAEKEGHANAEERRLLYVALTRARQRVFLLAETASASAFLTELSRDGYDVTSLSGATVNKVQCPRCTDGQLMRRQAEGRVFFSCSYWPHCDYSESACAQCGSGQVVKKEAEYKCSSCGHSAQPCPRCNGRVERKTGPHGSFLGCTNFPKCDFKGSNRVRRQARRR